MVASVTSADSLSNNLAAQIAPGSNGASSFTTPQPEITFLYPTRFVQSLYDISVPTQNSNVRQIETTYIASPDGSSLLTDTNGNVIRDRSAINDPSIVFATPREGLYGFKVKILSTSDGAVPKSVKVIANGCQKSSINENSLRIIYLIAASS